MNALLGSRYQVVREIGAGGMGRVFQGVDTQTGRSVAAKVMIVDPHENRDALLRFYQEGAVLSTLKHPNIVEVYGTFLEEGTCSIIMELLEGRSLDELLAQERLPLSRVRALGGQAAAALSYAHAQGIVHRDIKPSNIMVVGDDHVKVTDFGVARVLGGATINTATGMTLGTPLYMSPEQIEAEKVDPRSDIYSLGAVLYQMVAGRPPFEGTDALSIAFKHVHRPPQPPSELNPEVPDDWEELILRMLAKDPAKRIQTAAQVQEALARLSVTLGGAPARQEAAAEAAAVVAPPRIERDEALQTMMSPKREAVPVPVPAQAGVQQSAPARPASEPTTRRDVPWPLLAGVAALAVVIVVALVVYNATQSSRPPASSGAAGTFLTQFGPFKDPEAVTVDSHGNVYAAVGGENRIVKLSRAGKLLGSWGSAGSGPGHFSEPTGVAVDAAGNVYVADSGNNRIVKLSPNGRWLAAWGGPEPGSASGQFNGVHSVAVDSQGNVYAADWGNNRIVKLTPNGTVLETIGGPNPGSGEKQFDQPVGVAVDSSDNVYVADFNNNRIQKLSPSGTFLRQFSQFGSTGFGRPHGVAVDVNGNIYVVDYQNDLVADLTPSGAPLHTWGSSGSAPGEFSRPAGVWVDGQGNTYVADSGNNRIQKFGPAK